MPFESHPLFIPPENEDSKIWRYIDFTKFVSLLDTKSLFFVRADRIAQLDPFEGRYTNADAAARAAFLNSKFSDHSPDQWKDAGIDSEETLKLLQRIETTLKAGGYEADQATTFINSWHLGDDESDAMWKLYVTGDNGIAIRSTYKKLRDSFTNSPQKVFIGKVKYVDYDTARIPKGNTLSPYLHKKSCYRHESELRVIHWDFSQLSPGYFDAAGNLATKEAHAFQRMVPNNPDISGVGIQADVNLLVEELYVSPKAENWFRELVESVAKRFGYAFKIRQSDIYRVPTFQ